MAINKTIHELFEEYATHFPNHIAAMQDSEKLTYSELNHKANQLSHFLKKLGIKLDTPIGLCLERSFDYLISLIAILKSGGAYLPIDFEQPEARLLHILKDSQAPILITKSHFKNKFISYKGTLIFLDEQNTLTQQGSFDSRKSESTPNHLAYIIYTSGSTGFPKGVLIEHQSVVNYCFWFSNYTSCTSKQRIDFSGNPVFDMAITTTLVPLMLGLTVVICPDAIKKEAHHYLNYLAKSKINIIKLTPSYFKVLLQEVRTNATPFPDLKYIILGGENLAASECQEWLNLYPHHVLFNEYGPTEATVAVSAYEINKNNSYKLNVNVPIGTAGDNMSCIILNSTYQQIPDGEIGELFIGGVGLARGYLNRPDLTNQRFITVDNTRFYKTGDLCKKNSGLFEYLGRIDEQIKIRGYRIEPKEIEAALLCHPGIDDVLVVAQKDSHDELRLIAYCILRNQYDSLQSAELRQYLKAYIPDYMIPAFFIAVNFFPLTPNGKLDKAALPLPSNRESLNFNAPNTTLEKKLAQIWSEELDIKNIGLHDNFFNLGGHSLSAARIIARINNELNKKISLSMFYTYPNIAELTPVIIKTKTHKKSFINNKLIHHKIPFIPLSDFQFLLWMSHVFEPKAQKLNIVGKKRVFGQIRQDALEFAFQAIFKKHEVLSYQILKIHPSQEVQKNYTFKIMTQDLTAFSEQQRETILQDSITELINFYPWPRKKPLITARLFYLENESELQLGISHLISDDYCMDILFSELSFYYKNFNKISIDSIETDSSYKKYILDERCRMKVNLNDNHDFWENYLKDTRLLEFPKEYIIPNMKEKKVSYTTYTILPETTLTAFKQYCKLNQINSTDALGATIALALRNCCAGYTNSILCIPINIIKSTRDNPIYDKTMGCFLRVDPIKLLLDNQTSLVSLSNQIRQSILETSTYQQSSNLVKLGSLDCFNSNKLDILFKNILIPIYSKLFKIPFLYRKILHRYGSRIIALKRSKNFLINLNIRGNFFTNSEDVKLFDLKIKKNKMNHYDLLSIDSIFEVHFFRDNNHHYLAISANLKPSFREAIAQEFIHIMNSVSYEKDEDKLSFHQEKI